MIELSGDDRYRGLLDPLRRRARGAARGPRELVPDRAAAAGAAGVGDAGAQGGPARRSRTAQPSCLRVLDRARARRPTPTRAPPARRSAVWADSGVARLGFGDGERRADRRRAAGDDDQGARAEPARARHRARGLRPGRAARRRDAEADRGLRDAARLRRPLRAQGRAVRRGLVPARLARRAPADRPAQPARARGERDADPGHPAAHRRRRDREPDRHAADLRPGDRRRGAPRARAARARPRRPRARRARALLPARPLPDARHRRPRRRAADRAGARAPAARSSTPRRARARRWRPRHEAARSRRARAAAVGLVLLAWPAAAAEYRGSDLLGNVAPRVAGRRRARRPLPAVGLRARLPRRRRRDRARGRAADDRPVGGRAALERHQLPRQVDRSTCSRGRSRSTCSAARSGALAPIAQAITEPVRERHRRGVDGRRDPRRRPLGDLEGAGAAPLHRDGRRARAVGRCSC